MSLEAHLKRLITSQGAISVARFMHEALAHPEYGYYQQQQPFGKEGDFITAPEISQMFGEMIGLWCTSMWQKMDTPHEIALIELGPGRGTLMTDLLRGTKHVKGFHQALSIHMVESSVKLTALQQETLKHYKNITWHSRLEEVPEKRFLLIANEFFDALPIQQYIKTAKGWCESMVGMNDEGQLSFAHLPSLAHEHLHTYHNNAPEGAIVETCPAAHSVMEHIAERAKLHGGGGLLIDYGYNSPPYQSSLQAVKAHRYHPMFENIGEADITAHVDFQALATSLKDIPYQLTTQGEFLESMGIHTRKEQLLHHALPKQRTDIESAYKRLVEPEQMGELFKVLMFMRW